MADYTVEQYKQAARKALAGGDTAAAKRLIAKGRALEASQQPKADMSLDEVKAAAAAPLKQQIEDTGKFEKALFAGIGRGAANLADTPGAVFGFGADRIMDGVQAVTGGGEFTDAMRSSLTEGTPLNGSAAIEGARALTGGAVDYRGESLPERIVGTAGEFAPGAALGGAGLLQYALAPAVASELAGDATRGKQVPEWVPFLGGSDAEPLARTGAAIVAPLGAAALEKGLRKVVTPNPADPARVAAADRLKAEGVEVTAGQRTGNQNLMYREDAARRTQGIVGGQDEQFTQAALKRIGVEAKRATPDVMGKAKDRIGGMFNDLAKRNNIDVDQPLIDGAVSAKATYEKMTNKNNIAPLIANSVDDIAEAARTGVPITGAKYQSMRSELVQASTGSDGPLRNAAYAVRQSLDDAMGRTLEAKGATEEIKRYATARQQWKDYLSLENAVSRAGEDTALGILNPRQVRGAAASQSRTSYVTGQNDLGNLARDGNAVMPRLPQSGTQPRLAAQTISAIQAAGTGPTAGGLAYALTQDPTIAAAAAMAGIVAPTARNAMSASRLGQGYLGNQLMAGPTRSQASPGGLLNIFLQQQKQPQ